MAGYQHPPTKPLRRKRRGIKPEEIKKEKQMNKFESVIQPKMWFVALLLSAVVAGCSGGGGGDPSVDDTAGLVPMVTTVTPVPHAVDVPVNIKTITAAFTKAMNPFTLTPASFTLTCPAGTLITGAVTYLAESRLAKLTLPTATHLPANALCTATVTTETRDATGMPLASNFAWTFTTGTTLDDIAPFVTELNIANGATNVPINTKVVATFGEWMDPLTITAATFTLMQGATPVPGTVIYAGVSAVFTPASPLAANTTYTATITTGAKSAEDNALANDFVWSWTTAASADTTAPTVTGTMHVNGATNVAVNTKIGVTFSEGMDILTVTSVNFTVKETASGAAVPGIVGYSGVSAVFIPLNNLAPNTRYTVTVKGGTSGVRDLAGNPMTSDFAISWTTAAGARTTAPKVTGTIHANGATNVAINTKVGVTFSEGMDPLTVTRVNFMLKETVSGAAVPGTVSYSGVSAVFVPFGNLASNTGYTVTVKGGTSGVRDLAGNPMASDFVISWTTAAVADTTAPTVAGTIHANGATNVAVNTKISAAFSEGIDPLTITNVNFTVKETVSGTAVPGIVGYSGVNAVFITLNNLAGSTGYTVTVKGGADGVKDLAGNPMTSDYVWSWITSAAPDTTLPTVIFTVPSANAPGVTINSAVNATFSEVMDPLSITTENFILLEGGSLVAGTITYDMLNSIASFTPLIPLTISTTYIALISGVTDIKGNGMTSGIAPDPWSFTTSLVNLGSASSFAAFGGSAGMTNSGILTVINGDIGATAVSTAVTGFHDAASQCIYTETPLNIGTVTGKIYTALPSRCPDEGTASTLAFATQARADALSAYNALAAMPSGTNPGSNLTGKTLTPGTYTAPEGSFLIQGGNLTLDAQGNANAVWVFQMAASLTVDYSGAAAPQGIILTGGAQAKNVFWQVGTFATINAPTGGTMVGTIISQAGAAFSGSGTAIMLEGRALSVNGPVTLMNTVINVPAL
ncbi:MAG: Ig-like domain-containing protein [Sideroxyarcus sp.]|nr:Ig-like domain-containing protein [Sideroxyarcus sp.]